MAERIIPRLVEEEMKKYYLDYSLSVIVGRALPDVRDGLKPVHRRVLFSMRELGLLHSKPFKKCARVVGEVLGKYHPHGDMAVYDALVRMAQPFSLRYPLIDGHGNFGSIDGDASAAMRYTECRLTPLAEEMLADIDKDTVGFVPNFDGSLEEPVVLPSKVPNLLINGSSGIAVGMATNIPPNNMSEVCEAAMLLINSPDASVQDILSVLPGPDFPTGGIIHKDNSLSDAYSTGRGRVIVRGRVEVEEIKNRCRLIVKEIPYMVNKSLLVEQIAELVRDKRVEGISDIRDESDRDGMRVVIELKHGSDPDVVLNQLFVHSRLQESFSVIMLSLIGNSPRILNIKELLQEFLKHREDVITKRTLHDLLEAEEKLHILEGIIIALENIDAVVSLLRKSKDSEEAKYGLISSFSLTEKQAKAILELRIGRLVSLEQESIRNDQKITSELVVSLKSILADRNKVLGIIKQELSELKENFGDARRTLLVEGTSVVAEDELIKPETVVVTLSHAGYIKRLPVDAYKTQQRGGKGIIGADVREGDFLEQLFVANTLDSLLFFTDKGKVHWLKVHNISEAGRYSKGVAIANLLELRDERVTAFMPVSDFALPLFVFMTTKKGSVKKTGLSEFSNPRRGGILSITLDEGDGLISAMLTDGAQNIILATASGNACRFKEEDVRPTGRASKGVIGVELRADDFVVSATTQRYSNLLTISEKGYGKRTSVEEYRFTRRGGVGVTNLNVTDKTGRVVTAKTVDDEDQLILMSQTGVVIRVPVKGISVIGRATQGVRIMRLEDNDKIVSVAIIKPANGVIVDLPPVQELAETPSQPQSQNDSSSDDTHSQDVPGE
ncbi:DNA gyrase subunit A [Candidatus Woesearchaeota archaeon]|nr:DNA gyrase subunit A [Candidatus Woesearchaeota archaeon]